MNDLDKLLRQFEGADYFEEHPEQHSATWMYWWAVLALVAIGGFVWWLH